ncbi:MAG: hypothetical protein J6Y82_09135 [Bacteroidales bacterium]|nr:hypothetical protein [Bacteroidales bacterium]
MAEEYGNESIPYYVYDFEIAYADCSSKVIKEFHSKWTDKLDRNTGQYTVELASLYPGTTFSYRSYAQAFDDNNKPVFKSYGDPKEFTTKEAKLTVDLTKLTWGTVKLAVKGEFTASDTVTQHVSVYYSEYKHHLEDLDSIFTFSEHYDIVLDGKNTPVEVSTSQCDPSKTYYVRALYTDVNGEWMPDGGRWYEKDQLKLLALIKPLLLLCHPLSQRIFRPRR